MTMSSAIYARRLLLPLLAAALCLQLLGDRGVSAARPSMAFPKTMPRTVIWAWEEPEDLRSAEPDKVGVAYLAETLLLGDTRPRSLSASDSQQMLILRRRQPLAVANGAAIMAVIRIETRRGFMDSPELRRQTVSALAEVARRPGIRVLQVDFDATRSEREFYAAVLRGLRPEMPHDMPLSITALLSWCAATGVGDADWMAGLPVDEAVPMFFRLGGSARPFADKSWVPVRENLCRSSVGISTDESWPEMNSQVQRVYLFSPRPWTPAQLDAVSETPFGERDASLLVHNAALDAAGTGLRERVAVGPIIRNDSEELR